MEQSKSAEKSFCKELWQVPAAMNDADKIDTVLQRKIEEKNLLESIAHRKAANLLEFRLSNKERTSAFRLSGEKIQCGVGRGKKSVCYFDAARLGIPDPLRYEVTFGSLSF